MKLRLNNGTLIEEVDVDIAAIPANSTNTSQLVPVNGARGGMVFAIGILNADIAQGLLWQGISVCDTDGIVPVRFVNPTAAPIDPSSTRIRFIAL